MSKVKKNQNTPPDFDSIKKMTTDNQEFWEARKLMPLLGYGNKWQNFHEVIKDAMRSYQENGGIVERHFIPFKKSSPMPRGGTREIDDYCLSRWACYLIAMNGSPEKIEIAAAQNYFVVTVRKHEMHELLEQQKERIFLRDQVADSNKDLVDTAVLAGLDKKNIPIFHIAGYNALYDVSYEELMERKGTKDGEDYLNRSGRQVLAIHFFKNTQTEEAIRSEKVQGEPEVIEKHITVSKQVRKVVQDIGGKMPEEYELEPDIKPLREARRRGKRKELQQPSDQEKLF